MHGLYFASHISQMSELNEALGEVCPKLGRATTRIQGLLTTQLSITSHYSKRKLQQMKFSAWILKREVSIVPLSHHGAGLKEIFFQYILGGLIVMNYFNIHSTSSNLTLVQNLPSLS